MNLTDFLVVSSLLFMIGVYGALTRKNAIAVILSIELMLNAANLNFLSFWRYLHPMAMEPQIFVLVGITLAAAEAAVGLAVILNIYRDFGTINVDEISLLKG